MITVTAAVARTRARGTTSRARPVGLALLAAMAVACQADGAVRVQELALSEPVATPAVGETTFLGVVVGEGDSGHPEVEPGSFYGTDLGWTYEHRKASGNGKEMHILFGDTWDKEVGNEFIDHDHPNNDDAYGTLVCPGAEDEACRDGDDAELGVKVIFGETADNRLNSVKASHALGSVQVPVAGFSTGDAEFAMFQTSKPVACVVDSDCGTTGLTCNPDLGYVALFASPNDEPGLTLPCEEGGPDWLTLGVPFDSCAPETIPGEPLSGLCVDETSSQQTPSRMGAFAFKHHVGIRVSEDTWDSIPWVTAKFSNPSVRTGKINLGRGAEDKVLIWGRPWFTSVAAVGDRADLYFAYADIPEPTTGFTWTVHYYTGADAAGRPQFSLDQTDAVSLYEEEFDVVNQMSVAYVEAQDRWVMLYGGGDTTLGTFGTLLDTCGVIELFTGPGPDCLLIEQGNWSIKLRTAPNPWGPWSSAADALVGGDPALGAIEQYAPGGVLRHPDCVDTAEAACAPATEPEGGPFFQANSYGFLYGSNIIEEWTMNRGGGAVDIYWNASNWNPYRVTLFKTRLLP